MRLTVAVMAVVLGTPLLGIALPAPLLAAGGARGKRTVRTNCVHFTKEADRDARGLTFELHNVCDVPVEFTLRWKLSCGRGPAKAEENRGRLEPTADATFAASARDCADPNWSLHSIWWGWKPLPQSPAAE
jgi:hypothetical protein